MAILRLKRCVVGLALFIATLSGGDASALSSIERKGRTLAVRYCSQCHAIGLADRGPRRDAPVFRRLDQRLDLDSFERRLRQGLMSGHRDMPVFRFSRDDARALVSYLRSIQQP